MKEKIDNNEKCKHCEFLDRTFGEILKQKDSTNREYWLFTEVFVYLHGSDECKLKIMKNKAIGIISPYKRLFDEWIFKNKKENESYFWISRIDDIRGKEFSRIEKTDRYYEIKNFNELNKIALQRVR